MRALAVALWLCAVAAPAAAVQPDEVLSDTALEARARGISGELRCLVCRNESIDESSADLARDLRLLVRERLAAGDSDAEVIDYLVARYGEFVLLRPQATGTNLILWAAGPAMLALGGLVAWASLGRRRRTETPPLSDAERRRLDELLE